MHTASLGLGTIQKVSLRPSECNNCGMTALGQLNLKICGGSLPERCCSVVNVANAEFSAKLLAATTLITILGTKTLRQILSDREEIADQILEQLDTATDPWGIKVERVEVKDVQLPHQLQRAMAAEAEATREAKAKFIAAEGEQKAAMALKEASDIISESPSALQLRYLQTLSTISAEKNSTIIFPVPMELLGHMRNGLNN